ECGEHRPKTTNAPIMRVWSILKNKKFFQKEKNLLTIYSVPCKLRNSCKIARHFFLAVLFFGNVSRLFQ
ncbi:MAG: hypothetical protein LBG58_01225, partial [Planctomycetaceae bacterium]|nr:hypothetical protein [Planctomycetaceae bacterium]